LESRLAGRIKIELATTEAETAAATLAEAWTLASRHQPTEMAACCRWHLLQVRRSNDVPACLVSKQLATYTMF